jgi:hypothetical protein
LLLLVLLFVSGRAWALSGDTGVISVTGKDACGTLNVSAGTSEVCGFGVGVPAGVEVAGWKFMVRAGRFDEVRTDYTIYLEGRPYDDFTTRETDGQQAAVWLPIDARPLVKGDLPVSIKVKVTNEGTAPSTAVHYNFYVYWKNPPASTAK